VQGLGPLLLLMCFCAPSPRLFATKSGGSLFHRFVSRRPFLVSLFLNLCLYLFWSNLLPPARLFPRPQTLVFPFFTTSPGSAYYRTDLCSGLSRGGVCTGFFSYGDARRVVFEDLPPASSFPVDAWPRCVAGSVTFFLSVFISRWHRTPSPWNTALCPCRHVVRFQKTTPPGASLVGPFPVHQTRCCILASFPVVFDFGF